MSPDELNQTPAPHTHDWGPATCACGDTAAEMLARYRETLEEYVVALRQAQAASWQGDFQEACKQRDAIQIERDDFKRKYHEAMDILTEWRNIDGAHAVAELQAARAESVRLTARLDEHKEEIARRDEAIRSLRALDAETARAYNQNLVELLEARAELKAWRDYACHECVTYVATIRGAP